MNNISRWFRNTSSSTDAGNEQADDAGIFQTDDLLSVVNAFNVRQKIYTFNFNTP